DALSKKGILTRMLLNLQAIYVRTEAWTKAVAVLDRLLLLDPRSSTYLRNRGGVLVKLGRLAEAAREWEQYLEHHAGAEDAPDVRRELRRVRQALATLTGSRRRARSRSGRVVSAGWRSPSAGWSSSRAWPPSSGRAATRRCLPSARVVNPSSRPSTSVRSGRKGTERSR